MKRQDYKPVIYKQKFIRGDVVTFKGIKAVIMGSYYDRCSNGLANQKREKSEFTLLFLEGEDKDEEISWFDGANLIKISFMTEFEIKEIQDAIDLKELERMRDEENAYYNKEGHYINFKS